jgi:hypothetical protein
MKNITSEPSELKITDRKKCPAVIASYIFIVLRRRRYLPLIFFQERNCRR